MKRPIFIFVKKLSQGVVACAISLVAAFAIASCDEGGTSGGAIGEAGTDCNSGFCYDTPGPGPSVCSKCETTADCAGGDTCQWSWPDEYAVCM